MIPNLTSMSSHLGVFTPDVSLLTDAGTAITAIAGAFVLALGVAIAFPVARRVYRAVKGAIGGA